MHRCLQIPEIVHLVCLHLADASQQETLANLARVCRIFRQPATEELWSRMEDGIEPLLDGMGDDLWDWEADETASALVMMDEVTFKSRRLRRPITSQDLDALRVRASRVRELSFSSHSNHLNSIKELAAIQAATAREDPPFFLKLRTLRLNDTISLFGELPDWSTLHLFLGPSLSSLEIDLRLKTPAHFSFLTGVRRQCPNLTKIKFSLDALPLRLPSTLPDIFNSWNSLKALSLPRATFTVMKALSHLPNLAFLSVWMIGSTNNATSADTGGFPALKDLKLMSETNLAVCQSVLQLLAPRSRIRKLALRVYQPSPLQALREFLEVFPLHLDHSSLRELSFSESLHSDMQNSDTDNIDDPINLCALQCFTQLRSVAIETQTPISLALPTLETIAKSMPKLQRLKIGCFRQKQTPFCAPKLAFRDIIVLAKLLPQLEFLGLLIDASDVRWTHNRRPGGGFQHRKLETISVSGSPITSPYSVAALLSDVFPMLGSIMVSETVARAPISQNDRWFKLWVEAAEMCRVFRLVRAQERGCCPCGAGHGQS
ncbi:hypothetical protein BKA70DRAFT_776566 [Coprinopsis sp. MPI-PUGE-AT-0042]|nr:hypothetical protein BKA70DRAFT_776566 [Coprinopsis sp. MPI-PUGE-AT-0042]